MIGRKHIVAGVSGGVSIDVRWAVAEESIETDPYGPAREAHVAVPNKLRRTAWWWDSLRPPASGRREPPVTQVTVSQDTETQVTKSPVAKRNAAKLTASKRKTPSYEWAYAHRSPCWSLPAAS